MRPHLLSLYQNRLFLAFETLMLVILPVILFNREPALYRYRTIHMIIFLPYMLFVTWIMGFNKNQLGITFKNIRKSTLALIIPSFLCVLSIFLICRFFPLLFNIGVFKSLRNILSIANPLAYSLFFYSILSAPLQELIFRAYLTCRLELVSKDKNFLIVYTSIVFMLFHLPLSSFLVTIGTIFLGIMWEYNFIKFRNIFSLSLSHAIVGSIFGYHILLLSGY